MQKNCDIKEDKIQKKFYEDLRNLQNGHDKLLKEIERKYNAEREKNEKAYYMTPAHEKSRFNQIKQKEETEKEILAELFLIRELNLEIIKNEELEELGKEYPKLNQSPEFFKPLFSNPDIKQKYQELIKLHEQIKTSQNNPTEFRNYANNFDKLYKYIYKFCM